MKPHGRRPILLVLAASALFAARFTPASAASAAVGSQDFAQCAGCHSTQPGANGIGPSLAGVVGDQSGQAPGYDYSTALKQAKLTWAPATLDKFLRNPQAVVPGTKMFVSVPDAQQRQDLIAYLQTLHR